MVSLWLDFIRYLINTVLSPLFECVFEDAVEGLFVFLGFGA
jgi:hypothetical protein